MDNFSSIVLPAPKHLRFSLPLKFCFLPYLITLIR